jgi:hypothetical protein
VEEPINPIVSIGQLPEIYERGWGKFFYRSFIPRPQLKLWVTQPRIRTTAFEIQDT